MKDAKELRQIAKDWVHRKGSRADAAFDSKESTSRVTDLAIDNLSVALELAGKVAEIVKDVPLVAPVGALLSQILKLYEDMKTTKDKKDVLAAHITALSGDVCATVLRIEATKQSDLIQRLKTDLGAYGDLIFKASDIVHKHGKQGTVAHVATHKQLGGEIDKINEELTAFGTRFRNNRLVDVAININSNTETLAQIHDAVIKEKLEKWLLSPPEVTKKHHDTVERRMDGTGRWFLEGDQFIEWQDNPGFLWIEGHSGAGKSVLCSAAISQLVADQKLFQAAENQRRPPAIAYFYFDFRNEETRSVEIALRRIILQLSAQCPDAYKCLDTHYGQTLPSYTDLLVIIPELLRQLDRSYIIIDGLDECDTDDHDRLVELLSTLRQWNKTQLHVLFTSQTREIFTAGFESIPHIALKYSVTHEDIRHFVHTEIQTNRKYKIWRADVDRITEEIAYKSDGMFRLADCLLTEVSRCRSRKILDNTLKCLPSTLFEVYDRFLDAVPEPDLVYVMATLRWLMFATGDLTLAALADAISFDFSNPDQYIHEPDCRESNAAAIFDWLEGLVTKFTDRDGSVYVVLAHASVQDYATSTHFHDKFQHTLSEQSSHAFIARTCISYFLGFSNHPLPDGPAPLDPFSRYAARNWLHHMIRCDSDAQASLFSRAMQVFEEGSEQYKALCHFRTAWIPSYKYRGGSPLHICSHAGYINGVQALLSTGANIDLSMDEFGTALTLACDQGHTDIVALLLQNGADPEILSSDCGSALAAACNCGHIGIVRLLLASGANVNLQTGKYGSAFAATFSNPWLSSSHIDIARLLIDRGANIDPGAMLRACGNGSLEAVRFLVEQGANINQPHEVFGSALGRAAFQNSTPRGAPDVVRFLLESGADVNLPGGKFGSPLACACYAGGVPMVRLLLDSGADINLPAGEYGSALGAAASFHSLYRVNGCLEIIRLLFQRGADVKRHGNPALKLAVNLDFEHSSSSNRALFDQGRSKIVDLLREMGAVLDSEDEAETGAQTE